MKARMHARRRPRGRRRGRSRDGAVMLVVLLILLVATASAAVSVSSTQAELQAAGNERVATQTRYVAETGLATTISWLEMVVQDKNAYKMAMDPFETQTGTVGHGPPGICGMKSYETPTRSGSLTAA